jgi:hypothetical protein
LFIEERKAMWCKVIMKNKTINLSSNDSQEEESSNSLSYAEDHSEDDIKHIKLAINKLKWRISQRIEVKVEK